MNVRLTVAMVLAANTFVPALAFADSSAVLDALRNLVVERGVTARIVGECEHRMAPGHADHYVAGLAKISQEPTIARFEERARDVLLQNYAEGRAQGPASKLTPESCQRLIDQQGDLIEAAQRRLAEAIKAAQTAAK